MPLTRQFDSLLSRHAAGLPLNFLRALASRESDFNPRETGGRHWGLLQVGPSVIEDYNKKFGTSHQLSDVLDPELNVKMATRTLRRIVKSYKTFHPKTKNMREDWSNPEYVALVLAGWNSGYSEGGGVGRVAKYLEARNIPVTHSNVFKYSEAAGATKHLTNPTKQHWQRGVVDLFYEEGGPGLLDSPGGVLIALATAGAVGFGLYKLMR
jgi:soluble lytic murein transglycosylase-like protein